jgi:twitching motility protein PilI
MSNEPFKLLLDIASRSRRNAEVLPAQVGIQHQWSGIGFQLAGCQLVVAMAEVAEVLDLPLATRIPGVQPWVKGVINIRSRLLPLIDIEQFLGVQRQGFQGKKRVIVVEHGDLYCGLIVNEIHGMKHFPIENLVDDINDPELEKVRPYLQGAYMSHQAKWPVFDPALLVADERFMNAALH